MQHFEELLGKSLVYSIGKEERNMEPKHEIPHNDRLGEEQMDMFSAPVPSSFDEKWRSAIEREENSTMSQFDGNREQKQKKAARMGRNWWKAAVPAAAALFTLSLKERKLLTPRRLMRL